MDTLLVQRAIMKKGDGCDHTVVKKLHFVNKILPLNMIKIINDITFPRNDVTVLSIY